MRRIHCLAVLAACLSLAGFLRADDTVVLNDGTVLTGQVMEETGDNVVLMDHGVQRTLQRSLVSKVEFNTSPSSDAGPSAAPAASDNSGAGPGDTVPSAAPADDGNGAGGTVPSAGPGDNGPAAGDTVPAAPTQEQMDYVDGVSGYYQVPPDEVLGYEQQGIPYEELPVVFYVARRARCAPGLVVSLRLNGMSWADICAHFDLGPGIFYWRNLFYANLGGPYGDVYFAFGRYPHARWNWGLVGLTDLEIINCVNLRFETAWWHLRPYDVVRWRRLGHPFFWAGFGFRGAGVFHRAGFGPYRGAWGRGGAGRARMRGGRGYGGRGYGGRQGGDRQGQGGGGGGWNHN